MKDERILFLGGSKDGKREALPSNIGLQYQAATFAPLSPRAVPTPADASLSVGIRTETFTIKQFVAEDGTILKVAVHSSVKDVMKQLMKGYRYHRKPRRKYGW